jgi:hypothetical protein
MNLPGKPGACRNWQTLALPTLPGSAGRCLIYCALGRKADSDAQLATLTREHASDNAPEIAEAHA